MHDSPDDEEVSRIWLLSEQRSPNEIVVERGHSLSGVDDSELFERRLIAELEKQRLTKFELWG